LLIAGRKEGFERSSINNDSRIKDHQIKNKWTVHTNTRFIAMTKRAFQNNPGSDLLSHTPAHAVPSAVAGLTTVFGMGTGVTLPL
jgi:hypothetical protein